MRFTFSFLVAGLLVGSAAVAAQAESFDFTASGSAGGFSGSGVLTTSANSDGSYTISSITGPGVTGLLPVQSFGNNDNLLFPGSDSLVDAGGFSFADVMGNTAYRINLYSTAGGYAVHLLDSDGFDQRQDVAFNVTPVATPEPSSLLFLGTGVLGVAGLLRRRLA